jgi:hypothetical protein
MNSQVLIEAIYAAADRLSALMVSEGVNPENLEHISLDSVVADLAKQLQEQQENNFQLYGLYKETKSKS